MFRSALNGLGKLKTMRTTTSHEHEEFLSVESRDYLCLFRRDAGGGYLVTCEELPPMVAFGETLAAARANAAAEIVVVRDLCEERRRTHDPFRELRA